jgi:hypothetical protein
MSCSLRIRCGSSLPGTRRAVGDDRPYWQMRRAVEDDRPWQMRRAVEDDRPYG